MSQIEQLTAFFNANMPPRAMQYFESIIDDGRLIYAYKDLGLNQRQLGLFRYNAVLSWDRFPYRLCPPALVYGLVFAWVKDHRNALYDELTLSEPVVDIEFDTDDTGSLMVTIEVADTVSVCMDEAGEIPLAGKRWRLQYPETWIATQADLSPISAPVGGKHGR